MDGDGVAPMLARHFVSESLLAWHYDDPDHLAELLTSELVTNVVQHAASPVMVEVCLLDGILTISATDASRVPPVTRSPDTDAEHGRGMQIVSGLSRDWGVLSIPTGKTVWLEIAPADDENEDGVDDHRPRVTRRHGREAQARRTARGLADEPARARPRRRPFS
jgi:hypothetical protein